MSLHFEYVYPPIPTRRFDWAVYNDNKCCCPECHPIIGYGPSKLEALFDYAEQVADGL